MKEIQLTQCKVAIVDDDDYERLSQFNWHFNKHGYAMRNVCNGKGRHKMSFMHREILELSKDDGKYVDHINGDKLDNRRENLRVCSNAENVHNQGIRKNNTSGLKGVVWHKVARKWFAQITINRKNKYLGLFATPDDAHEAYCAAALKYHGQFANFGERCVATD